MRLTKLENGERGFVASESLADDLQAVLIDLIELHIQAKQAHWNVVARGHRASRAVVMDGFCRMSGACDENGLTFSAAQTPDAQSSSA